MVFFNKKLNSFEIEYMPSSTRLGACNRGGVDMNTELSKGLREMLLTDLWESWYGFKWLDHNVLISLVRR